MLEVAEDETRTGSLLGTPAYMAPEQAEGRLADIGPATDVYALGVLLYELIAGRPPFRGPSDVQTLQAVSRGEPPRPNRFRQGLSRDLEAIILKCLAHDPTGRYASAIDLANDLDRFLTGAPTLARPAGPIEKTAKWMRRRPAIASLLAVVVLAAFLLAGGGWWYSGQSRIALNEARQRELESQRFMYVSNVNFAAQALVNHNVDEAERRLLQCVPRAGDTDLREIGWRHLRQQLHDEVRTLRGHTARCIAFAMTAAGTAWLRRVRTGRRESGTPTAVAAYK